MTTRQLHVDKPPTCAGEWLMPPGEKDTLRNDIDNSRERVAAWLRRFSCEDPPNVAGRDFIDLSLTWADELVAIITARQEKP